MPELILHLGSGKTGSSSIQSLLAQRRDQLRAGGVLYPLAPGRTRHVRLGLSLRSDEQVVGQPSWEQQGHDDPAQFREWFRATLLSEIADSGARRVLLSDEALYGSNPAMLDRLRSLTETITEGRSSPLTLVVYLRRQDDHLVSRYQQVIKTGETRRLVDRTQSTDFAGVYDYLARLRLWQGRMAPTSFHVRPFERGAFAGGSLLTDFVQTTDLDLDVDEGPGEVRNVSLDAEAVEFLRLVNLVCRDGGLPHWRVRDQRRLVDQLGSVSGGPTLTLPDSVLERFMEPWEDGNRTVAREFVGAQDGVLFRMPRKTSNTTTEQRLDPRRAEHLLTQVDLPESSHSAVRVLAEREAMAE